MQTSEPSGNGKAATESRILAAAATLFGGRGFNGVSTRDIAAAAEVNEVTVYRHFPHKRDLYLAVIAAQLGRVSLRGDLLNEIAQAPDARTALTCTFELISATVIREPQLVRLILYSSLELRADLDMLLRKYLGELVEVVARYLEPWIASGDLQCKSAKALVLAIVSIVAFHQPLHRAFVMEVAGPRSAFEAFAGICLGTSNGRTSSPAPVSVASCSSNNAEI